MKLDTLDLWTISNENNLVTCFKNDDIIKNFNDIISHQSEIEKFQVFGFLIIFQNMMTSVILISTSERYKYAN